VQAPGRQARRLTDALERDLSGIQPAAWRPTKPLATADACAPRVVSARLESAQPQSDQLPIGTRVASTAWSVRVVLAHGVSMGLTGGEQSSMPSVAYAVLTRDNARTWRIASPLFWRAAAQGAAGATAITALGPSSVMVWGHAGNAVHTTADAGRHWYLADFACGVDSARVAIAVPNRPRLRTTTTERQFRHHPLHLPR
jgi:hypothetical protein